MEMGWSTLRRDPQGDQGQQERGAVWMGADRPRVQTSPKLPLRDPRGPSSVENASGTQERGP